MRSPRSPNSRFHTFGTVNLMSCDRAAYFVAAICQYTPRSLSMSRDCELNPLHRWLFEKNDLGGLFELELTPMILDVSDSTALGL